MSEVGIELDDLAAAIVEDQINRKTVRYRSAAGKTWSGEGETPQGFKHAIRTGQSVEHFAVERATLAMTEMRPKVDWS